MGAAGAPWRQREDDQNVQARAEEEERSLRQEIAAGESEEKDKEASKKLAQTVAAAAAEDSNGSDCSNHSTATLVQVDSNANDADADADSGGGSRAKQKPKRAIKLSVWSVYDVHDDDCKEKMATCTYDKGDGKVCGKRIRFKSGTSGMWNHLQYCQTDAYVHLKEESKASETVLGGTVSGMVITEWKRAELHAQHAVWLVKHKRPFSTVYDKEYRNLWGIAYSLGRLGCGITFSTVTQMRTCTSRRSPKRAKLSLVAW